MSKATVQFSGFEEMRRKLNNAGANVEEIAKDALKATNELVYKAALEAMQKPNLPALGRYSHGETVAALRKEPVIEVQGTEVIAHVGFDIKKGGLASIFLMYGTPRMSPDQKLHDAFFGQEAAIMQAQRKVFERAMERYFGQ